VTAAYLWIDCGNTRIKWALSESATADWLKTGSVPTQGDAPLADFSAIAAAYQTLTIVVSNVAGEKVAQKLSHALQPHAIQIIQSLPHAAGVTNHYQHPAQLGTDRFAALIAAKHLHSGNALVVMAGTATTIDTLTQNGEFLGGVILPGLSLMQASLHQQTAQLSSLSEVNEEKHKNIQATFPRDTAAAISQGAIDATIGAIMENIHRLRQHTNEDAHIIASGGAVHLITDAIAANKISIKIVDDLVLRGLQQLYLRNTAKDF
jgi:type III pantothenate kinase